MSSPFEQAWPPNFYGEIRRRAKLLDKIESDGPEGKIRALAYYRTHPVQWINDFCVTFDPRLQGMKKVPFTLFPRQVEFILFLEEMWRTGESGLVEKCRDIGATWLCSAFSVWLWLFHDDSTIGWGSRKAEYVDDSKNPKAIFPKIRQIIENLPVWMQPQGYEPRKHATYMKIINTANGATISGEAGDGIGRGGRTSIYFKDESAHYEHPEAIEAALGDNTNVQIDISSVNGSANVFYRRRNAGIDWKPGAVIEKGKVRVFIFDWRHHPGKTQAWYDQRRSKAIAEGLLHMFAQEVDRDYSGSLVGIIIKNEWATACIGAAEKLSLLLPEDQRAYYLELWEQGEQIAAQDIADGGRDTNAIVGRHGSIVKYSENWGGEAGDAARKAVPICTENKFHELYYDSLGVGSGFKTEINTMEREGTLPQRLRVMKWNASAAPLDPTEYIVLGDDQTPTNEDMYLNIKAQGWFRLRARVYKTYLAVVKGYRFPVEEMISFPANLENLHTLIREMSQPVSKTSQNGKTMVDKKPEESSSPNMADALMMCFNPCRELSILDVLD